MDSFLRNLERKAKQGDIDALWQAYYGLKRSLSELTNDNLKELSKSCEAQLVYKRSFDLYYGNTYYDKKDYGILIEGDDTILEVVQKILLKTPASYLRWVQKTGKRDDFTESYMVTWTPDTKIRLFKSKHGRASAVEPTKEYEISGDEKPEPNQNYLVWIDPTPNYLYGVVNG